MALLPNMTSYVWNEYWLYLAAAVLVVLQGDVLAVVSGQVEFTIGFVVLSFVKCANAGVVATLAYIKQKSEKSDNNSDFVDAE